MICVGAGPVDEAATLEGARITVRHHGVVIHDDVVRDRNIWVLPQP